MTSFDRWMKDVDEQVQAIAMVSVYDLPDCSFNEWFAFGYTAKDAALAALEYAGF